MAKKGRAVVVEGYTDVIAAHAAGVGETVAVMGTAITPDQVKLLAAHTGEVVLALDADRAGREAMLRAQGVAAGKKVRLRVAAMPEGEDPADMLGGEGPGSSAAERFERLVEEAVDLSVFHVGTLLDDADLATPDGRDRALDEVVPVLKAMADSITRDELMREVGERLGADPGLVARRLAAAPRAPRPVAVPAPRRGDGGGEESPFAPTDSGPGRRGRSRPRRGARRALLQMCIAAPAYGRDYIEKLKTEHLSTPAMGRVRDWLAAHLDEPVKGLPEDDAELAQIVQAAGRAGSGRAGEPGGDGAELPPARAGRDRAAHRRGRGGGRDRGERRAPEAPSRAHRADRAPPVDDAEAARPRVASRGTNCHSKAEQGRGDLPLKS